MRTFFTVLALVPMIVTIVAVPLDSLQRPSDNATPVLYGPKDYYNITAAGSLRTRDLTAQELKLQMEPFEWAMCGDPADPLQVFSASLSPYPIKFSKDRELPITLALNGSLSVDVGEGGTYDMILKKKVPYTSIWQKIPCIDEYGSCSYDLCQGCENIFGPVCDAWFIDHNIPCHCPFLSQIFTVDASTLLLPAAGSDIPAWLVDGDFQVQLTFNDKNKAREVMKMLNRLFHHHKPELEFLS